MGYHRDDDQNSEYNPHLISEVLLFLLLCTAMGFLSAVEMFPSHGKTTRGGLFALHPVMEYSLRFVHRRNSLTSWFGWRRSESVHISVCPKRTCLVFSIFMCALDEKCEAVLEGLNFFEFETHKYPTCLSQAGLI